MGDSNGGGMGTHFNQGDHRGPSHGRTPRKRTVSRQDNGCKGPEEGKNLTVGEREKRKPAWLGCCGIIVMENSQAQPLAGMGGPQSRGSIVE